MQCVGIFGDAPGDEAAANSRIARASPFSLYPVSITVAAAKKAHAPRLADGSGQSAAGDQVHRREQNRMFDVEQFRKAIANGHYRLPQTGYFAFHLEVSRR